MPSVTNDPISVQGAGATASPPIGNPIQVAGFDGTNLRVLQTTTNGVLSTLQSIVGAADAVSNGSVGGGLGASAQGGAFAVAVSPILFNNTTWDRQRGNVDTTTGDTGAKTATFNGATQINYNHRGAFITIILGTVSGTLPTLAAQLQWSPDGGTTFINLGAVLPNLTASSQTGTIAIYPTNFSTAGATPAALTINATVNVQSNSFLPRTWRLAYTIGGTTPSFTISSVNVNYVL